MRATAATPRTITRTEATTGQAEGMGDSRLGFVHRDTTTIVIFIMKTLDRRLSLGVRIHLDETEPLAATRVTALDDLGALHGAERCEPPLQIRRGYRVSEV